MILYFVFAFLEIKLMERGCLCSLLLTLLDVLDENLLTLGGGGLIAPSQKSRKIVG